MREDTPSAHDPYPRQRVAVLDSEMAYVDTGQGAPIVFLHGNPTSSYLWRNVLPYVAPLGRCLAPDLIGMGQSGKLHKGTYRFEDHAQYLDAWFEAVGAEGNVTLVLHDWGSALGFHWYDRFPERVRALVYMEAIVAPYTMDMVPKAMRDVFTALRSPAGEAMVLEQNLFIEQLLPGAILRDLSPEEMDAYRAPFLDPGEGRRPMLTWPREVPFGPDPEDVYVVVAHYGRKLKERDTPKLFINADPGLILRGKHRDFCRTWKNQREVTVPGLHFVQEDAPGKIGRAIADFLTNDVPPV